MFEAVFSEYYSLSTPWARFLLLWFADAGRRRPKESESAHLCAKAQKTSDRRRKRFITLAPKPKARIESIST